MQSVATWSGQTLLLTLLLNLGCLTARAAEPGAGLHVHVADESCPSAILLRDKLEPLLDDDLGELDVSHSVLVKPGVAQASVRDLGQRYIVELEGRRREIDDASHDCVERARVAAVFIALNMQPGPSQDSRNPALRLGLQLSAAAAYAPQISGATGGGAIGLWLERASWHVELSVGVLAPLDVPLRTQNELQPTASLLRVPLQLLASYLFDAGSWRFGPAVGVALDIFRLRGANAERPQTALRIDPGLVLAADLGLQLSAAWSLGVRLGLEALARAYELKLDRSEALGRTPRIWLSAGLSLSWRFL